MSYTQIKEEEDAEELCMSVEDFKNDINPEPDTDVDSPESPLVTSTCDATSAARTAEKQSDSENSEEDQDSASEDKESTSFIDPNQLCDVELQNVIYAHDVHNYVPPQDKGTKMVHQFEIVMPRTGKLFKRIAKSSRPYKRREQALQVACNYLLSLKPEVRKKLLVFTKIIVLNQSVQRKLYEQLQTRIHSFISWPSMMRSVDVYKLSNAGFFYSGKSDKVHCFHCYAAVDNWNITDDAIERHERANPYCGYLLRHTMID